MPVWGRDYMAMSANISPYYDHEAFARAKILALTEYVYRLQANRLAASQYVPKRTLAGVPH